MLPPRDLTHSSSVFWAALLACLVVPASLRAVPVETNTAFEETRNLGATSYVRIDWQAPKECPDAASVQARTERLLGQPLHAVEHQRVLARARVRLNEAGNWELSLSLRLSDQVEDDTLVAKQCGALADATALKVALAIDPVATARAIEASTRVPQTLFPIRPTGDLSPAVRTDDALGIAQSGVRFELGGGFGLLPGLAAGGGLGLWLQRFAWRGELTGHFFAGEPARYPQMPAVGARLQLFAGGLRGCHAWRAGSIELPLCLGVDWGLTRGTGFGLQTVSSSSSWWGAVVLAPGVRLPVSERVALWLEVEALVPFARSGFDVRGLGPLYTAAPLAAAGWAGCEIRLSR